MPYVIEPAAGADRATLAFLLAAYHEEEVDEEGREAHGAAARPAPRADQGRGAAAVEEREARRRSPTTSPTTLRPHFMIDVDDAGSIGRRYRRQDEVGTPLCVTVDFDSLDDRAVTVRDRDTMEQDTCPARPPRRPSSDDRLGSEPADGRLLRPARRRRRRGGRRHPRRVPRPQGRRSTTDERRRQGRRGQAEQGVERALRPVPARPLRRAARDARRRRRSTTTTSDDGGDVERRTARRRAEQPRQAAPQRQRDARPPLAADDHAARRARASRAEAAHHRDGHRPRRAARAVRRQPVRSSPRAREVAAARGRTTSDRRAQRRRSTTRTKATSDADKKRRATPRRRTTPTATGRRRRRRTTPSRRSRTLDQGARRRARRSCSGYLHRRDRGRVPRSASCYLVDPEPRSPGSTLGKRSQHLQVVRDDGSPLGWSGALMRYGVARARHVRRCSYVLRHDRPRSSCCSASRCGCATRTCRACTTGSPHTLVVSDASTD